MKERPIIFSGDMVRAILAGTKTQTRRIVKPQPCDPSTFDIWTPIWGTEERASDTGFLSLHAVTNVDGERVDKWIRCPYGKAGKKLWARESFAVSPESHQPDGHYWLTYTSDGSRIEIDYSEIDMARLKPGKSYPSMFMPRWASRITLEITGVRVERVQDISKADARAEGHLWYPVECEHGYDHCPICDNPITWYQQLWDSINGKKPGCSFADNPWVWVVTFKRLESSEVSA